MEAHPFAVRDKYPVFSRLFNVNFQKVFRLKVDNLPSHIKQTT